MPGKNLINPKVTFATGGSVTGLTIGKALSILALYLFGSETTPPDVELAIEFIIEAVATGAGAFLAGYFKGQ